MWKLCLIRDVINTYDDTIHILSAYVCDWSLGAHKILPPILSLKSNVTATTQGSRNLEPADASAVIGRSRG